MNYLKNLSTYSLLVWITASVLLICSPLQSQYFGRNKVKYEDFDFKIMKSETFKVYYYPGEETAVQNAIAILETWHSSMDGIFNIGLAPDQPIILYANHADFQQTNVTGGIIPQGTGGFTEGLKNRIVLPFSGINSEDKHVLGHELVHAFQYKLMRTLRETRSGSGRTPLWMVEGMAEYLSIGRKDPLTAMWMRDAIMHNDLPAVEDLARSSRYFPYRWGHAMWSFIASKWGDEVILDLFTSVLKNGMQKGFNQVLGVSGDTLSAMWKRSLKQTYAPQVKDTSRHKENLRHIIGGGGGMNMAPSLSPNGKYIAFLSRRELFTIDLYLADAKTGEVIKKLVSSNTDQHFDALRFMNSAGSWSPEGSRFAFVVFKNGDNGIAILDVERREVEKTISMKQVDQITNIAWSPDGNRILYSGAIGGISDLFIYDLKKEQNEQITDDLYSEIQPSWSPDGKKIAFATDRGPQTDLQRNIYGPMKIAVMSLENDQTDLLYISEKAKHINPYFSADGKSIFMVADPDGISNVYRYELASGRLLQLTHLLTGVSGLTELSPAMSVASNKGLVAVSVYEKNEYNIYTLDASDSPGDVYQDEDGFTATVSLPIAERASDGRVEDYLHGDRPVAGLEKAPKKRSYDPSLRLIHIGQAGIGIVADRYGATLGGGVSMFFSDMLGNHVMGVAVQSNGGLKDIGGQVMYQNLENRYNWGASLAHIPYQTASLAVRPDTVNVGGDQVLGRRYELLRQRIFIDRLTLNTEYPLSQNRRLEFGTGYTRYTPDYELEYFTTVQGFQVDRGTEDLQEPNALNLFQSSVAYVGDYSFFGFTSPVDGRRYRFEAEPTIGSLKFVTLLADYRYYHFQNPVTFAVRGMHIGRYWEDAESSRLPPLYLGYQTYLRGYSLGSIDFQNCQTGSSGRCLIYDQLVGSRMALVNAEVRLPFFGTEEFGLINFPYVPTELVAFADGGVTWSKGDQPELKFDTDPSEHVPVFSTGVAARVNLMGYAVLQFYYAHAFQREKNKGQFGFFISPGW